MAPDAHHHFASPSRALERRGHPMNRTDMNPKYREAAEWFQTMIRGREDIPDSAANQNLRSDRLAAEVFRNLASGAWVLCEGEPVGKVLDSRTESGHTEWHFRPADGAWAIPAENKFPWRRDFNVYAPIPDADREGM